MKINNLNENLNRFQLLGAIFAEFPDLSSEDEDYLNQLSSDELISEIKNRGWEDILQESLNEYWDKIEDTPYYKVASKSVMDSDGFWTEYTMYYNEDEDNYFFIFGDSDLYGPDPDYADWECDTNEEAVEWYNNYNGFEDEEDMDESCDTSEPVEECSDSKTTLSLEEDIETSDEARRLSDFVSAAYATKGPKRTSTIISSVEKALHDMPIGMRVKLGGPNGAEFERVEGANPFKAVNGSGRWEFHTLMDMIDPSKNGFAPEFYLAEETDEGLEERLTIDEDLFDEVELPDASPAPEVTVESEPSKETPDQGPEFGISSLLNNLIVANWSLNDSYNDLISNSESNNMPEIAELAKDIAADINNHIGKLQVALSTISPNVTNIAVGEEEAKQHLDEPDTNVNESISPEDQVRLEKRGTVSRKIVNKLNEIVSKYNGYHEPAEIRNMWDELMNENVEVEMISGYGKQAEDGGRSWTVGWSLEGIPVMNSMFVYAVYEPQDSTRNEYTIYFS